MSYRNLNQKKSMQRKKLKSIIHKSLICCVLILSYFAFIVKERYYALIFLYSGHIKREYSVELIALRVLQGIALIAYSRVFLMSSSLYITQNVKTSFLIINGLFPLLLIPHIYYDSDIENELFCLIIFRSLFLYKLILN
jgi:hypothetical protein